jgi:hypothetical protein
MTENAQKSLFFFSAGNDKLLDNQGSMPYHKNIETG